MGQLPLRHLIQRKLADGRLPRSSIQRVWGGAGNGETCDACEEAVSKRQLLMGLSAGKVAGVGTLVSLALDHCHAPRGHHGP